MSNTQIVANYEKARIFQVFLCTLSTTQIIAYYEKARIFLSFLCTPELVDCIARKRGNATKAAATPPARRNTVPGGIGQSGVGCVSY